MTIKEEITNNLIGIQFLTEQDGLLKFIDSGDEIDGHFIIFDSTKKWMIYVSHESTITFAGVELLKKLKMQLVTFVPRLRRRTIKKPLIYIMILF